MSPTAGEGGQVIGSDSVGWGASDPSPALLTAEGGVVSYRLARERAIASLADGTTLAHEACDAQPELRRVAHNHGKKLASACPICEVDELVTVAFAFGPGLPRAGRCVTDSSELERLRRRKQPTTCYRIEVCRECWWNHLIDSFQLAAQ